MDKKEKKILQPHQQRVVEEYDQLMERKQKLFEFIEVPSPIYPTLPPDEKKDLKDQWIAMTEYSQCLKRRIERFQLCLKK